MGLGVARSGEVIVKLGRGKVEGGEAAPSTWCKTDGKMNLVLLTSVLQ